ncbi:GMC oxidoreductase [Actinomadura livida]|uniref:Cholesterol oxidase n=1 Tax=Actinomadura livida TaxID=79909 RepID=A0A7W7N0Q1_9ACTN|nr:MULTISPECIES: GMC family oxidoreductase [Actinomadura]MBB4778148.1 cholesterol oxidase [Actinomadura catellatispora]GGU29127.1 cholesterol oxidase [Actinomadura livida]
MKHDFDVLVVGSGFGGSVSALRLTEKGYRVGVIEAGRRFDTNPSGAPGSRYPELPKTNWRVARYLWAPAFGLTGIQRMHLIRGAKASRVMVLAGAGVGGGSLNYANTLYVPPGPFFKDRQWAHITDWQDELAPYYEQAKRMLGVVQNTTTTAADEVMKKVADRMGVGDTFVKTPVGVYFGRGAGIESADPYFGGTGPRRRGCMECGECMVGCRHGAKNMLTENYLYLAEKAGARVMPLSRVTTVRPLADGGYEVEIVRTGSFGRNRKTFTTGQVVFAAGTYGTQKLLHKLKSTGVLPRLSDRLGALTRTNSEAILGGGRRNGRPGPDFSQGVAITSSFHPAPDTHIEPVRYGRGSNLLALLQTLLVDGDRPGEKHTPRVLKFAREVVRRPRDLVQLLDLRRWSERTVIALVMQTRDNSITLRPKKGPFGWDVRAEAGHGEPNPTWIPKGHEATRLIAEEIEGMPGGAWGDLFDIPLTAHFLGGCAIGDSPETGVIDAYHRVYGHPGLHVVDGSAVSANLGVNPSLTITAQAERAMSFWPNHAEDDPRPALGDPYRRVVPVPPKKPAVPADAPAALRLPIVEIT